MQLGSFVIRKLFLVMYNETPRDYDVIKNGQKEQLSANIILL
jgi:hypothetical protein